MKFTLSWLKEHLDTKFDINAIESTLTNIGLEVESIKDRADELKPFTVAKVMNVSKHPNADRLKVCNVKTIEGDFQVVCGAPNAKTGMLGIFAPENSYIPGTKVKLKKSIIRGVESRGMLVSDKEMGISEEHEGIIEIDPKYKIGDSFPEIYGLNDPIIEINITPNRSDCLSVRGIARDLAAAGLGNFKKLKIKKIPGTFDSHIKWQRKFKKDDEKLCSGVSGRLFKNIKNVESPDWLQKKLLAIGLKPISALVDITNYVTFDLGRPLHVYDADKLHGNLSMRLAKDGEKCKTLDEKEYTLSSDMVVISDDIKLHGIGGVMGGLDSGCSMDTTNAFLEVALFDRISVTKTGRKLNLQSDARFRFERGIDSTSIDWGVDRATEMILELCGGEASKITSDQLVQSKENIIKYDSSKVRTLGGVDIDLNHQIKILESLGFVIKSQDQEQESLLSKSMFEILIPYFRPDIVGSSDIVEEIIRIYGYDKIKPQSVIKDSKINKETLDNKLKPFYKSKRLLASRGYFETVTWSFMSSRLASYFYKEKLTTIKNPISEDLDVMRPTILPNLLNAVSKNISRLYSSGKIFEVGPQFKGINEDQQEMVVAAIQYGSPFSQSWNNKKRTSDVFDIKNDVIFLLDQLNVSINKLQHESIGVSWYHPGKSTLADRLIQICGGLKDREMKEQVLDSMELERERGITIKAQTVRLNYKSKNGNHYTLNLMDTPGHVDFSYEVSRSLSACEGSILIVDSTQGIEAQTLANAYLAINNNHEILPVLNKIDLSSSDPERVKIQIKDILGIATQNISLVSAKSGEGVHNLLEKIINFLPSPEGEISNPLQCLLVDSWYDSYLGVVVLVRVINGELVKGQKIKLMASGASYTIDRVGIFTPKLNEINKFFFLSSSIQKLI